MVSTNHRLSILDDEGTIVTAANQPASAALGTFIHGRGQHEHPPLSDILLHGWLVSTHYSLAWLRVPAIFSYIAGLLILAICGERLGGIKAYWAVLLLGTLWPFGYFYARITGWYCFCFLLVSLLTHTYLTLVERATIARWAAFTVVAIMLLWSNYYGVAILLVLLFDLLRFHRPLLQSSTTALLISASLIALSFLPLLRALMADAQGTVNPAGVPLVADLVKIGYMLFALLASVAVAPWFLPWGVPIGIAATVVVIIVAIDRNGSRFALYFFLLIIGLALASHLDLKRLLFVTPWMVLAIALACSRLPSARSYTASAAVSVIFLIGWIGIATGRHPATINFYEPWQNIATESAQEAREGATIISDSTPYFFYFNHAVGLASKVSRGTYLGPNVYDSRGLKVFNDKFSWASLPSGKVIVILGRDVAVDPQFVTGTLKRVADSCKLVNVEKKLPDPAVQFKKLLGVPGDITPYRVVVEHFDCDPPSR